MDRCLIHPAVKFTCHSYSGPLHNSSTCYSSGAHNISFIKNPVSSSSSSSSALLCATAFHMEFILCLWAAQEREEFKDSARTQVPGGPPAETMMTLLPPPHTHTHLPASFLPSILTLRNEGRFDLAATCKCAPRRRRRNACSSWTNTGTCTDTASHARPLTQTHTHKQRVHLQRDSVSMSLISRWEFPIITRSSSQHNP